MGLRETINKNPIPAVACLFAAALILFFIFNPWGGGAPAPASTERQVYFTTDLSSPDAAIKAAFADGATKLAPFTKDGKEAVRIRIYSLDEGKTKFVTHYERLTPIGKSRAEAAQKKAVAGGFDAEDTARAVNEALMERGMVEARLPDAPDWRPIETVREKISARLQPTGDAVPMEVHPQ